MYSLLTMPISLLAEFINLHLGLFLKFSLRSFNVINDFFWLYCSILSSIFRSCAIIFAYALIVYMADQLDFFYVLLIFSVSNLLYSSVVSSGKLLVLSAGINSFGFFLIFFFNISSDSRAWKFEVTFLNLIFWISGYHGSKSISAYH